MASWVRHSTDKDRSQLTRRLWLQIWQVVMCRPMQSRVSSQTLSLCWDTKLQTQSQNAWLVAALPWGMSPHRYRLPMRLPTSEGCKKVRGRRERPPIAACKPAGLIEQIGWVGAGLCFSPFYRNLSAGDPSESCEKGKGRRERPPISTC
jgi:hypothetical protein